MNSQPYRQAPCAQTAKLWRASAARRLREEPKTQDQALKNKRKKDLFKKYPEGFGCAELGRERRGFWGRALCAALSPRSPSQSRAPGFGGSESGPSPRAQTTANAKPAMTKAALSPTALRNFPATRSCRVAGTFGCRVEIQRCRGGFDRGAGIIYLPYLQSSELRERLSPLFTRVSPISEI